MRWIESSFDYMTALADPTGRGLITSADGSDQEPKPVVFKRPKAVVIRGVLYKSHKQAADALGVHYTTVSQAAMTGRLDELMPKHWWIVDGREFDTLVEAAEFFGETERLIRKRANKVYMKSEVENV